MAPVHLKDRCDGELTDALVHDERYGVRCSVAVNGTPDSRGQQVERRVVPSGIEETLSRRVVVRIRNAVVR